MQCQLFGGGEFRVIRATTPELRQSAKDFVNRHHSYIKWSDRPSRKLYWLLYEDGILVGVFGLGSAFARPRDVAAFLLENGIEFNEFANNTIFCLSGCKDHNAGSRFLKLLRLDAMLWWRERYGDTLKAIQTFVLPPRSGAVYKADNWRVIGKTAGGRVLRTRTLKPHDAVGKAGVEIRTFKSGEVKHLTREYIDSEQKIILARIL